MRSETQALHLARIMQKHIQIPSYDLSLPPVMVPKKKLKKLCVDDIILCGFERPEFLLVDGDTICANMQLKKVENGYIGEIVKLQKDTIKQIDSKKYKNIKISFGALQSKGLKVGDMIDINEIDLEKVKLVLKDKTIAEGSLVIVDEEIAVQIERVS